MPHGPARRAAGRTRLNLADYNELGISGRLRFTPPPAGAYPTEDVLIDPAKVAQHERPSLNLVGSVCTEAWCADNRTLHLRFPGGHRIEATRTRTPSPGSSTANVPGTWPVSRVDGSAWSATIPDDAGIITEIPLRHDDRH